MTDGTRLMFVPNSKSQMSLAARRNICYLSICYAERA